MLLNGVVMILKRISLLLCLINTASSNSNTIQNRYGSLDEETLESFKKQLPHIHQNIEYPNIDDGFEDMETILIDEYEKGAFENSSNPNHQFIEYIFNKYGTPLYYSQFENGFTGIHYGRRLLRNLFYLKAYAYEYKLLYEKIHDKNPYPEIPGFQLWLEKPKDFKEKHLFMLWDEKQYHLPRGYFPKSTKAHIASRINNLTLQEQNHRMMRIKGKVNFFSPGYNAIFSKQFEDVRKHMDQQKKAMQNK